jgi:hypothetical protein
MSRDPERASLLPCNPCPHESACCWWGTPLEDDEAALLARRFGEASVTWDPNESEWRTAVVDGACVFLKDNTCSIHDDAGYPSVCAGFPWLPDDSEVDICPELLTGRHPELDALFDPVTKRLRVMTAPSPQPR